MAFSEKQYAAKVPHVVHGLGLFEDLVAGTTLTVTMPEEFEILPYPCAPKNGTRLATENMIFAIDAKIAKLAALGLRPHVNLIGYRRTLVAQMDTNDPYRVRVSSGIF